MQTKNKQSDMCGKMDKNADIKQIIDESGDKYKYGFVTDIKTDTVPKGLSADIIRLISSKKNEPEWLLERRLKAFEFWQNMQEPTWAKLDYDKIDIRTTADSTDRLLLVKDSFADCMIPFLIPYYREIIVVDADYYQKHVSDLLDKNKITSVLFLYDCNNFVQDDKLSIKMVF